MVNTSGVRFMSLKRCHDSNVKSLLASIQDLFSFTKMADDIDDLLDEVESKFCDSRYKKQKDGKVKAQSRPKSNSKTGGSSSFR